MSPTIHLVRHAQGVHNLSVENESIHDPDLTRLGEQQCATLRAAFPYHDKLTRLVASPLRRTINTCAQSFGASRPDLYPILALDTLQEVSDQPCDTGSTKNQLAAEFGDKIDLSRVRDTWTDKTGAASPFEATVPKLTARAKEARLALREIAGHGDEHIAVVSHGGFLHFLTDDWDGIPTTGATAWTNCMCRSYKFAEKPTADGDYPLIETEESWTNRLPASQVPPSALEQNELRAGVQKRMAPFLKMKA